ncbi:MAG: 6-phosphogluconolactonase [Pseudomonadota bacterium]|nr:6-phosphogluconolactonase [Pseudomonadota bacterium]
MSTIALPRESSTHSSRWDWFGYPSLDAWRWASAVAVAAELRRDLQSRPRARLLLSGGATPAPVYRAMAKAPLDWDRIDVALVDERWLMPDDPDSNARLVRTELLTHHAAQARFETMTCPGRTIEQAVAAANAHGQQPASVVVLGMGADGHIASLFPHMFGLRDLMSARQSYAAVDAHNCPGAREWARRISLTPAGMANARARLLLIRGQSKREAFERAIASGDMLQWPVLAALSADDAAPLQIYWCP